MTKIILLIFGIKKLTEVTERLSSCFDHHVFTNILPKTFPYPEKNARINHQISIKM